MRTSVIASAAIAFAARSAFAADDGASSPLGNSFSYPVSNDVPPVGTSVELVWQANTTFTDGSKCNTVTLELLHGLDSKNLAIDGVIAKDIPNVGSFAWTPSKDLIPGDKQYGIKLTCKESGNYQYTDLFAVANPDYKPTTTSSSSMVSYTDASVSETSTESSSSKADATTTAGPSTIWTTDVVSHFTTYCPAATTLALNNVTYTVTEATWLTVTDCPCTITYAHKPTTTAAPVTHTPYPIPHQNATTIMPTGSVSMPPASISPSMPVSPVTTEKPAESTISASEGAASTLQVSFIGAFAAVLIAALAL